MKIYHNLRAAVYEVSSGNYDLFQKHFGNKLFPIPEFYQKIRWPITEPSEKNIVSLGEIPKGSMHGLVPLWEKGYNGTGVVIGIIDTGVEFSNPSLSHAYYAYEFFGYPNLPGDKIHGTAVASVMVSNGSGYPDPDFAKGVAYGAKLAVAEMAMIVIFMVTLLALSIGCLECLRLK